MCVYKEGREKKSTVMGAGQRRNKRSFPSRVCAYTLRLFGLRLCVREGNGSPIESFEFFVVVVCATAAATAT